MKKILWIALSAIISLGAHAQKKNEAEVLVEKVSKRYKVFKSIKADFVYSIENKQEKSTEKQKGTLLVKGNKFRLDIANQLIICDNKTVWTFSREVNEVQISNYDPKKNSVRIDDLFTMYAHGFLYRMLETKKENGKEIVVVELTPKDKKKSYFKIKLTIDKTNQTLLSTQVFDKSGTINTYTLTNQVPNLSYADNQFVFDKAKFPGVEVIDLR